METHVSIIFRNFSLYPKESATPLQMELSYETKKIKFNYPQSEPLKINFSSKFIQDKLSLVLSTSIESSTNKKNKISYRSDITLNKTIFSENNKAIYEKNITIIPIEHIKEIKEMKEMKKIGKILMQIQLLDSFEDWKKNLKNLIKKKTGNKLKTSKKKLNNESNISNSKNNNINSKNNNSSQTIKKQSSIEKPKKDEDILSEITVEPIYDDEIDDNKAINELNKLISLENINQLKEILKKDYKKIFPIDINALKTLNENLYKQFNELSVKYNEILQGLNNANENTRKKAVKYYKEYKELKEKLDQKNNEYKIKQKNIDNEKSKNIQENDNIKSNLQKYYQEKEFFFQKLITTSKKEEDKRDKNKSKDEQKVENISPNINNEEIKMLKDALKKISSLGYDLFNGLDITNEEKELLNIILGEKDSNLKDGDGDKKSSEVREKDGVLDNNEADKEDYDLSNQIVGLIERDVNDLYARKLIEQVKIDQIDAITYSFEGNKNKKEVEFKIENGNLVCNTGESFTVWLISNFSI